MSEVGSLAGVAMRHVDADDWSAAIRCLGTLEQGVSFMLRDCVAVARERGATWQHIGDLLGVTRQSAHERFAGHVS